MRNLLTNTTKKYIKKEYQMRLSIIIFCMVSFSFIIGAVALLPSFILSSAHQRTIETEAAYLMRDNQTEDTESARLVRETKTQLSLVEQLQSEERVASRVETILQKKGAGIYIQAFEYRKREDGFTLVLEGGADTRDDLLLFERGLKEESGFDTVSLPLSDLAADSNITFTITVTGT